MTTYLPSDSSDTINIISKLTNFGLSEKEAKVYIYLLKEGECTHVKLSMLRRLSVNDSTTNGSGIIKGTTSGN